MVIKDKERDIKSSQNNSNLINNIMFFYRYVDKKNNLTQQWPPKPGADVRPYLGRNKKAAAPKLCMPFTFFLFFSIGPFGRGIPMKKAFPHWATFSPPKPSLHSADGILIFI
jgi:hypothetical protein